MERNFYYIAQGKLHAYKNGAAREVSSGVLDAYLRRVKDSAQRNEWKHTGEGAMFREAYVPGADVESRVAGVMSKVHCAAEYGDSLIYSLSIDRTTGIYRQFAESSSEGIVLSGGNFAYQDFDVLGDCCAVSAGFAGESHIGVLRIGTTDCRIYTEGHCWDSQPVWSKTEPDTIFFCSAGLAETPNQEERSQRPMDMSQMATRMFTSAAQAVTRGPSAIMKLDVSRDTLDEWIADDTHDYIRPQSMADGSLYYIRRPYTADNGTSMWGCLGEIVMLPVRILGALFGFLNVFSAKYSGKTLSKSVGVKNRDEEKLFIEGNLISAEAELRANRNRGEQNPGIIPHSWELHCRKRNGDDVLVRRGVVAYRVDDQTGDIMFSNGSAILNLSPDGKEEIILSADQVTFIR